jgi:hypothetical protein
MYINMLIYLVFLCVVLMMGILLYSNMNREGFQATDIDITPDYQLKRMLNNINRQSTEVDMSQYVKKTGVEQSARAVARDYCPVPPDFDMSEYIKKSDVQETKCPAMPDLKDYVLKSSIPPAQQCPSCICPKVKVASGMCKKCPEFDASMCPAPQPCGVEQCKNIIKCAPGDQVIPPCPKCPEVKPCPKEPVKICPAVKLPSKEDLNCPAPQPCPQNKCPPCKYYGMKESDRDVNELIDDLIAKDNRDELRNLKNKLAGLNLENPADLQKTIQDLQLKLEEAKKQPAVVQQESHNHSGLNNKLNTILKDMQNLKQTKASAYETDSEDEEPEVLVKPAKEGKCMSFPMKVKNFNNSYKVVGATVL